MSEIVYEVIRVVPKTETLVGKFEVLDNALEQVERLTTYSRSNKDNFIYIIKEREI